MTHLGCSAILLCVQCFANILKMYEWFSLSIDKIGWILENSANLFVFNTAISKHYRWRTTEDRKGFCSSFYHQIQKLFLSDHWKIHQLHSSEPLIIGCPLWWAGETCVLAFPMIRLPPWANCATEVSFPSLRRHPPLPPSGTIWLNKRQSLFIKLVYGHVAPYAAASLAPPSPPPPSHHLLLLLLFLLLPSS